MIKTGSYEIFILESGRFALDGGAVFGLIPKPLWSKLVQPDERNRITMSLTTPLVIGRNRKILIDTGVGSKLEEKLRKIYKIDFNFDVRKALKDVGIEPEEITDVVVTHLHFDHVGGCLEVEGGQFRPVFPRARYFIQRKQLEWAKSPTELDRASFIRENFMPLIDLGVAEVVDGEFQLYDGIKVFVTNGHTPGQQHVLVEDSINSVFFVADLIPMSYHIPTTWITAFDLFPVELVKEKKRFLTAAYKNNWILVFPHDPDVRAVRIEPGQKYFEVKEVIE